MEKWIAAIGYDGKYEISNYGNVRNTVTGKYLKPSISKTGYYFVKLDRAGAPRKNAFIHRLVAENFILPVNGKFQVNHKDGDKSNNCVENLEWVTPAENIQHSFSALGKKSALKGKTGAENKNSRPVCQYTLDGDFVRQWPGVSDAARNVGCSPAQILNVIAGRIATCHGYIWAYEKSDRIDNSRVKNRKTHKRWGL